MEVESRTPRRRPSIGSQFCQWLPSFLYSPRLLAMIPFYISPETCLVRIFWTMSSLSVVHSTAGGW